MTRIAPWRLTTSAIAWTSCTMPVEVSLSVAKHHFDALVLAEQPVDRGGIEALAPARLVAQEIRAVGLAELIQRSPNLPAAQASTRVRPHEVRRPPIPWRPSRWKRR
jgi:hypothetical protein